MIICAKCLKNVESVSYYTGYCENCASPVGKPKRTHSNCCEAELIITPAFPVKERVIICGSCGQPDYGNKY